MYIIFAFSAGAWYLDGWEVGLNSAYFFATNAVSVVGLITQVSQKTLPLHIRS